MAGWLICTAMKMAPARAVAMPAAWPRRVVVTVMAGFLCWRLLRPGAGDSSKVGTGGVTPNHHPM